MLNRVRLSIEMEEVRMESLYLRELTSIKLKLMVIQTPERWLS